MIIPAPVRTLPIRYCSLPIMRRSCAWSKCRCASNGPALRHMRPEDSGLAFADAAARQDVPAGVQRRSCQEVPRPGQPRLASASERAGQSWLDDKGGFGAPGPPVSKPGGRAALAALFIGGRGIPCSGTGTDSLPDGRRYETCYLRNASIFEARDWRMACPIRTSPA